MGLISKAHADVDSYLFLSTTTNSLPSPPLFPFPLCLVFYLVNYVASRFAFCPHVGRYTLNPQQNQSQMTMGGGPELKPQHERVLVALPGPEPTALLGRLKEEYPHVDVEFVELGNSHDAEVPKGKANKYLLSLGQGSEVSGLSCSFFSLPFPFSIVCVWALHGSGVFMHCCLLLLCEVVQILQPFGLACVCFNLCRQRVRVWLQSNSSEWRGERLRLSFFDPFSPTFLFRRQAYRQPEFCFVTLFFRTRLTLHNIAEKFADKTVLVTFMGLPKKLEDAPKLKWLHLLSAGSNHIQKHPIYTDSDITITTSSGIHGPQVSLLLNLH